MRRHVGTPKTRSRHHRVRQPETGSTPDQPVCILGSFHPPRLVTTIIQVCSPQEDQHTLEGQRGCYGRVLGTVASLHVKANVSVSKRLMSALVFHIRVWNNSNVNLFHYHLTGVHPYWVGDLDSIILRNPDLYGNNGFYGHKKSLSQQLVI